MLSWTARSKVLPSSHGSAPYCMFMQDGDRAASHVKISFESLQPTLLLFLKQVQQVVVTDRTGGAHVQDCNILKKTLAKGLVEIRYGPNGKDLQKWLVVEQTHQPSMKREGMHRASTEVALAFELDRDQPRQQHACAFLPLRQYGLKFIVQVMQNSLLAVSAFLR